MQDKKDLEAERKRRENEEVNDKEKTDSLKATRAAKRREEEPLDGHRKRKPRQIGQWKTKRWKRRQGSRMPS